MPSSVVASIVYDSAHSILQIGYVSGAVYAYLNVPPAAYKAMMAASSKGVYLNKFIKGRYQYRKLS